MSVRRIPISEICTTRTQTRATLNYEVIAEYAERMEDGEAFPPIKATYDGSVYYLAAGFHRVEAARKVGYVDIEAEVKDGGAFDAIIWCLGDNAAHGHRRTKEDSEREIRMAFEAMNAKGEAWTDREMARRCCVSGGYWIQIIATTRSHLLPKEQIENRTVTRNGKTYEMNTAAIGKRPAALPADDEGTTGTNWTERDEQPQQEHSSSRAEPTRRLTQKQLMGKEEEMPSLEEADPRFKQAWEALFTEVKNAKKLKWRTVPQKTARHFIQVLLDIIEIGG